MTLDAVVVPREVLTPSCSVFYVVHKNDGLPQEKVASGKDATRNWCNPKHVAPLRNGKEDENKDRAAWSKRKRADEKDGEPNCAASDLKHGNQNVQRLLVE
jgi:hypothetical protein